MNRNEALFPYPTDEEKKAIVKALAALIAPDVMTGNFIDRMTDHLIRVSVRLPGCLLNQDAIPDHISFIFKGSALIVEEYEVESDVEGEEPIKKERILDFLVAGDFIYSDQLISGEGSKVRIDLLEKDTILLCMEKRFYMRLKEKFDYTTMLTDAWVKKRDERMERRKAEREGKFIVDQLDWLMDEWKDATIILTQQQMGDYFGVCAKTIRRNLQEAIKQNWRKER